MLRQDLNYFTEPTGIDLDELGMFISSNLFRNHISEQRMEELARDIAGATMIFIQQKMKESDQILKERVLVDMAKQVRSSWVKNNPPNHAGYYYCHICGGHVHETEMELDHVVPKALKQFGDPNRDDNLRPSHPIPVRNPSGELFCPGNSSKGSCHYPSTTMDIRPPDEAI